MKDPLGSILGFSIIVVFASGLIFHERIHDIFRLDGQDTIREYREADSDSEIDWHVRMRGQGACLSIRNWRCGFDLSYEAVTERVDACFRRLSRTVDPDTPLDTLRKYCGSQFAHFSGQHGRSISGSRQVCAAAGGEWGRLEPDTLP